MRVAYHPSPSALVVSKKPNLEAMRAFAWIMKRRKYPEFTFEDAGQLTPVEVDELLEGLKR